MHRFAPAVFCLALLLPHAHAADGLVTLPSPLAAKATLDKLEALATARGLKIFTRIDHAAGAQSVGLPLRPTELLILGHPKGGTPLMQCEQTYGIDLPLRVLAWEDAEGKAWLAYRLPAGPERNPQGEACGKALKPLAGLLDSLVREAVKP